jgi:hypothetical protein
MSPLSLLVIASIVAALAFFVAGFLLRRPRAQVPVAQVTTELPAAEIEQIDKADQVATLTDQLASLRALHQRALAEAEKQRQADVQVMQEAENTRRALTRERDSAQAECARLLAKEKTLAERLRAAEDSGRAALEQVESNAAAWDARWQAAEAERARHEQARAEELAQLRERCERQAKEKQDAEFRERSLRADLEHTVAVWKDKHAQAEAAWQGALASQQAAAENKVAASEAAWQTRLEAASRARQSNESTLQSEKQQLTAQLQQLRDEQAKNRERTEQLTLALQTAEETLVGERAEAKSTVLALRAAEERMRDWDRLTRENAELRDERARAADDVKWAVDRDGEAKDAKVELAAAQAKLAELGEVLQENRRLRDEVGELRLHQGASDELERLTSAHKQLRLDAELMARRLQELKHDQAELVPLRAQAAEAASLEQEVVYLRRREKELEAQLYASGFYASREMPALSGELFVQTPVSNMETSLDSLLGEGGPRTAVLADSQGFLIAGAGESFAQEGLAAFAAVAGEMVARTRMLLPLAEVHAVRVTDANRIVLTCHLFNSDAQGLGIATLGPGEPSAENTQQAIVALAAIISGEGEGEGTDDTSTGGGKPNAPG